ncbi:MAG: RecQ family zinc-binding domain-containing protein, partial [Lactococcus plantarum]|nr:RecQ family zinc-binding domain-containing protein [Lactococcus plantarum]
MTGFTATQDCLQHYIVQYFGEQIPPCGICSTCTDTRELTDMTLAAQKVLSNIVRMGQLQAGNYSKTQVVAVLRGKLAEKMRWTGFDTLSTYGLLSDWPVKKLNQFIDYLVADGYLLVSGEYNGLSISEKGIGVLKSEQSVMLREIKTT